MNQNKAIHIIILSLIVCQGFSQEFVDLSAKDNGQIVINGESYFTNGGFEHPRVSTSTDIPLGINGWTGDIIQVGPGRSYNLKWGPTQVANLDVGNVNRQYTQTFTDLT